MCNVTGLKRYYPSPKHFHHWGKLTTEQENITVKKKLWESQNQEDDDQNLNKRVVTFRIQKSTSKHVKPECCNNNGEGVTVWLSTHSVLLLSQHYPNTHYRRNMLLIINLRRRLQIGSRSRQTKMDQDSSRMRSRSRRTKMDQDGSRRFKRDHQAQHMVLQ